MTKLANVHRILTFDICRKDGREVGETVRAGIVEMMCMCGIVWAARELIY